MMSTSSVKYSGVKTASHSDLRGEQQKKIHHKRQENLRIGTWNVRTLLQSGKLENLKKEMELNRMDIIGLSEVRWEGQGEVTSDETTLFYSGNKRGKNGVGIIMKNKIAKRVQKVSYVDDRLIVLRIEMLPKDLVMAQVYMPTSDYDDEDIERMYESVEKALENEENCCKIVMGDWNAVVGEGREGAEVGNFGLGKRNERGERLIEFCKENKLIVANTFFQNHKRRRYTWISPVDKKRYQIDYILVEERYKNAAKKVKGLPGADINSDHVLVMMEMSVKLKKLDKAKKVKKWNMEKMKEMKKTLGEKFSQAITVGRREDETSEETWGRIKRGITETAKEEIGYYEGRRAKKPWVTEAMLMKMVERRKYKMKSGEHARAMYRRLNNELRRETQAAREKWLSSECEDIEGLEKKKQYDLMYKKVRNVTWDGRKAIVRLREIENKEGKIIYDDKAVRERWSEYVKEIYATNEKPPSLNIEEEWETEFENRGLSILKCEIEKEIKEMKEKKSAGVDELPIEFFKCLTEKGLNEIVGLCNKIYNSGKWPEDFLKIVMIPIPKKAGTKKCTEYRTISLIAHAAKILLRVLNRRLRRIMEENTSEEQFGFRQGKGTRDAIALLRIIGERYMERGKGLSLCFIDLEKAFDRVDWRKLMDIMKEKKVDWKERRLIAELYLGQRATVKVNENMTDWVELGRGVRQGCCLSPTLFNIYVEDMISKTLEECVEGISIGGVKVRCIRFADDMVVLAEDTRSLQGLITRLEEGMEAYGMRINVKKTKVMKINYEDNVRVKTKKGEIENVQTYSYLGTLIEKEWKSIGEIKRRIGMAKEVFNKKKRLLCNTGMELNLRKRLAKCYVWSVLAYGSEAWTMGKKERDRVEAFEMWVWRRMERISWTDHVSNEQVLDRVHERRTLLGKIYERKGNWLGHVMRGNGILKAALEGAVEGNRRRGRRKLKLIDTLKTGSYEELKRLAWNRDGWRRRWRQGPANRQNTI